MFVLKAFKSFYGFLNLVSAQLKHIRNSVLVRVDTWISASVRVSLCPTLSLSLSLSLSFSLSVRSCVSVCQMSLKIVEWESRENVMHELTVGTRNVEGL